MNDLYQQILYLKTSNESNPIVWNTQLSEIKNYPILFGVWGYALKAMHHDEERLKWINLILENMEPLLEKKNPTCKNSLNQALVDNMWEYALSLQQRGDQKQYLYRKVINNICECDATVTLNTFRFLKDTDSYVLKHIKSIIQQNNIGN